MIYEMRFRVELDTDDEAMEFFVALVGDGEKLGTAFERSDIIKYQDPDEVEVAEGVVH